MLKLVSRFAGDPNEKELNRLQPLVDKVGELESSFKDLTDKQLRAKTSEFTARLQEGESLDDLLPESFAAVREASKRTTAMRHFDVQILGGIILHQGKVVEMKTGEGKTLVATLPLYLNGLVGRGAHLVTVNDYLARRDVQWMGPIYYLLGLTVGLLQQGQENAFVYDPEFTRGKFNHLRPVERKEAYQAHVTHGTNHEFGFDYLRDNLAFTLDRRVQRELHYAIIDEVDNILIDEARTPLIISGPSDEPLEEYRRFARIARKLRSDVDYEVDEKERNVILTEAGLAKVEAETGIENIYDEANYQYVHYMEQALKAQVLFRKDRDYIKQGQRIVLVDEFTGRLMPDRRLSEGLHQAIEAKEGVRVLPRMMTQATITLQNYFRMYEKLAGMTGTASTEAEELDKIYSLDVMVLPTNVEYMAHSPDSTLTEGRQKADGVEVVVYYDEDDPEEILFYKRIDYQDVVYKTEEAKWEAIAQEIEELHQAGRPVLVGTTSVEKSERLSAMLGARRIEHEVLNAKNHTREAAIIAKAGEPKGVTIATNMAGRGVDIKLGGELSEDTIKAAHRLMRSRGMDPYRAAPSQLYTAIAEVDPDYVRRRESVLELGGLHVLGTERHEARRIDNQLRGRAGRQGEPGSSRFYLSLQDDLMRRFGGPSVAGLMDRLGVDEDIPIEHGMVSRTIEGAQTKVEGYNFDIRKHLLDYDDVLNRQRELIYGRRYQILTASDLRPDLWEMLQEDVDHWLKERVGKNGDRVALISHLDEVLPLSLAPPDAPLRYQFPFFGNLTCFAPFSVSFLAGGLAGKTAEETPALLLEMIKQASAEYREHLLESVVRERFDSALERYRQEQERYAEFLENKIDDYVDLMEEQDRAPTSQELLQYVQSVFPIPLKVKASDLRGLSPSEAKDQLLEQLDRAFHQQLCETLIQGTQGRTPEALKLDKVRTTDLAPQQMEALRARALAAAPDEDTRTQLSRLMDGKSGVLDLLLTMTRLVKLDLETLSILLGQAVAIEYDRWEERELEEIERSVKESAADLKDTSAETLSRVLLEVLYTEKAVFDKAHARRVTFAPRLPLPFVTLPLISEMGRDELQEEILEHLERALLTREEVWGRQELARLGQRHLTELDIESYKGLAEHLGESVIRGAEGQLIGHLEGELQHQLRVYLGMREIETLRLSELPNYSEVADCLARELEEKVEGSRVSDLDQRTIDEMEEYLMAYGYFEDTAATKELLDQPIADLDSVVREAIASHLGQETLDRLKDLPVAQWDAPLRHSVQEFLQTRGHFVDEDKVQQFFVHRTLGDLGQELALDACTSIVGKRLHRLENRPIGMLKGDLQQRIPAYLQRQGVFVNEAARDRLAQETLAELNQATSASLGTYLGRQMLEAAGRVSELPQDVRRDLQTYLSEHDYFTDKELLKSFRQGKLSALGEEVHLRVRDRLMAELELDLEQKLIGELDPDVQEIIYRYLEERDYFDDDDKVRQFDNLTVSDLEAATVHVVEEELGQHIVAQLGQRKFMNLDQETRESILHHLDLEGLYRKKKKREQLLRQSLAELDKGIRDGIAHHLGRARLTEFRETRLADLPDELRDAVWRQLRQTGHFVDKEKREYLEIEEVANLDSELRKGLRAALERYLEQLLSQRKVAEWPDKMQARIQVYLDEEGRFIDPALLARFEASTPGELDPESHVAACQFLGQRVLAEIGGQRFSELRDGLREEIESYLHGTDYFVDAAKRQKFLQRRPADLDPEILQGLVASLSAELATEMMDRGVAEFDDGSRQSLREFLDSVGYFLDHEALARFEGGMLADLSLDKGDYQGLASWLGQRRLKEYADQRLIDLEETLRLSLEQHLRSTDYFLDSEKLQRFRQQRLADLDDETRADVLKALWQRREEAIRSKRLTELDEETRESVQRFLSKTGEIVEQAPLNEFRDHSLDDLDEDLRQGLARHLGHQRLYEIRHLRIAELDGSDRTAVQGYIGRRLMHQIAQQLMLGFISRLWVDYLTAIEDLRQGIGLQAYGQRDPLVEYKRRAFGMFGELNDNIRRMVVGNVFRYPPQPLRLAQATGQE